MAKNYVFCLGILLLLSLYCKAQVEPFTKYYNLDPEWVGNYFEQIIHTPDGGYAAVFNQNQGFTMRTSLLKLDQFGEIEWQTVIEDESYLNMKGFSLCRDDIGNYYIAGNVQVVFNVEFAQYDALLSKFDSEGNFLWSRNYNLNPENIGTSEAINKIIATESGKVIAVGCQSYCEETPYENSLVLCFDINGEIEWMWHYCDENVFQEGFVLRTNLASVIRTDSGAFYAVGSTNVAKWFDGSLWKHSYLGLVIKFNKNGEIIFSKSIGLPYFQTNFTDICMISDNAFAVTGWFSDTALVNLSLEDQQALFIFDSTFNLKYQTNKFIGGGSSKQRIAMTEDSMLFVVAATDILRIDPESDYKNDLLILKYSTKGELLWHKFIGGHDIYVFNGPLCVVGDQDYGATFGFYFQNYNSKYTSAAALMKIDSLGNGDYPISDFPYPDSVEYIIYNQNSIETIDDVAIYPNPARDYIIIELSGNERNTVVTIFDLFGKEIINTNLNSEHYTIDVSMLKPGVYLVKTQTGLRSKFIKL